MVLTFGCNYQLNFLSFFNGLNLVMLDLKHIDTGYFLNPFATTLAHVGLKTYRHWVFFEPICYNSSCIFVKLCRFFVHDVS